MKIMKKIISMVGAIAMVSSLMAITATAANNPTVTTSIEGYTGVVGETFNVVVEYSGFEDLFLGTDDWSEKGITAMEIHVNLPGAGSDIVGTGRANAIKGKITYPGNTPSSDESALSNGKLNIVAVWGTSGEYNYDCGKIIVPVKIVKPFEEGFELSLSDLVIETTENDADGNMIDGGLVAYNDADITKVPGKLTLESEDEPELVENDYVFSFRADQDTDVRITHSRNGDKTYDLPNFVEGAMEVWGLLKITEGADVEAGDTFKIETVKNRELIETIKTITVQAADLQ